MITRRANKKDTSTQCDTIFIEQLKNNHKSINNSDKEVVHEVDLKSISSPTFNIHIHVPYYEPNNAKLFLPRIQPIIHLHFDEIAKRLANSTKGWSEKSLSKTIENLLAKTSPKFGDVKFHFKIDTEEKDVEDREKIYETPCSSIRQNNDAQLNENNNSSSINIQNLVSESNEFDVAGHSSNSNNNNNTGKSKFKKSLKRLDPSKHKFDENIKLKKAVVVLTDICKNKNYQNILERNNSATNQNNNDKSLDDIVDKIDEHNNINKESESFMIKAEKESCTSVLLTPNGCKNNNTISDNYPADISGNHQVEKEVNKSPLINLPSRDQNLTSLVEGWSFSDILNRFQIKHSEYLVNSAKYLKTDKAEYDGSELELNRGKMEEEGFEGDEEQPYNDNDSHFELNENKLAFKECNSKEIEYESGRVSPSLLDIKNEAESNVSESELNGRGPILEVAAEEVKPEFPENNDSDSDVCENILRKEVSSDVILDLDLVKPDLSNNKKSDLVSENNFEEGRIMNSSLNDPGFHLFLIQKEILRRALTTPVINKTPKNLKKNKSPEVQSVQPETAPSPKKMKHSDKETNHSRKNLNTSMTEEDYILINSPGPTQFAVASLDKVTPYKTHEAKNFREKVLFGDRVNRFSSPEKLRILKLKREATRKLMNK